MSKQQLLGPCEPDRQILVHQGCRRSLDGLSYGPGDSEQRFTCQLQAVVKLESSHPPWNHCRSAKASRPVQPSSIRRPLAVIWRGPSPRTPTCTRPWKIKRVTDQLTFRVPNIHSARSPQRGSRWMTPSRMPRSTSSSRGLISQGGSLVRAAKKHTHRPSISGPVRGGHVRFLHVR